MCVSLGSPLRKKYPLIDQTKPNRTPVRTFLKLLAYGRFYEIKCIVRKKSKTLVWLITNPNSLPRRLLRDIPILKPIFQRKYIRDIYKKFYNYDANESTGRLRIALIIREGTTRPRSSAFIRLISPLTDPSIKELVSVRIFPENTTNIGKNYDICIIQRTVYDNVSTAKKLLANLEAAGTSLVVDSDDAFSAIDRIHPEHDVHQARLDAFNYLLNKADEVWFSTEMLARAHSEISNKVKIVPNSLDPRIWKQDPIRAPNNDQPLQFVYMGTATHNADLAMILPALENTAKQYPKSFVLNVIGVSDNLPSRPWIRRILPEKGTLYPLFVTWFSRQHCFDIGLSPLVDSNFNRSKSDIKCLDYIAADIVPLVSDFTPYKSHELDKFIIRVKNTPQAWENALSKLVANTFRTRAENKRRIANGKKYLWNKRSSSKVAKQLLRHLEDLAVKQN